MGQTASRKAQALLKGKYTLKRKVQAAQSLPELCEPWAFVFLGVEVSQGSLPASLSRPASLATWRGGGGLRPSILFPGL